MKQPSLSPQQEAKLAEALEVAQLAEEKASQMSKLATQTANKYQQHLHKSIELSSKSSN